MGNRWRPHQRKRLRGFIFSWRLIWFLPMLAVSLAWIFSIDTPYKPPMNLSTGQKRLLFADSRICYQTAISTSQSGSVSGWRFSGGSRFFGLVSIVNGSVREYQTTVFYKEISVDYSTLAMIALMGVPIWLWRYSKLRRRILKESAGLCFYCGYDLRASTQQCPECGHSIEPVFRQDRFQNQSQPAMATTPPSALKSRSGRKRPWRYLLSWRWLFFLPLVIVMLTRNYTLQPDYIKPLGRPVGSVLLFSLNNTLYIQGIHSVVPNPQASSYPSNMSREEIIGGTVFGKEFITDFYSKRWLFISTIGANTQYWEICLNYDFLFPLCVLLGMLLWVLGFGAYSRDGAE